MYIYDVLCMLSLRVVYTCNVQGSHFFSSPCGHVCAGDGDFSRELLSANCWIHSDPHVTHKNSRACHVTGSTQSLVHFSPQMSKTATLDR